MREISTKVKPSNDKARRLATALFLIGMAVFLISMAIEAYSGIVSTAALVILVFAIMIHTKYIAPVYYYDLTRDYDGNAVFVVRQITGKRESTLCRIDLSGLRSVEREDSATRREHKTPSGYVKYNYSPTLMPEVLYRITYICPYERAEILIEASDEYAETLRALAEEARAYAPTEEE